MKWAYYNENDRRKGGMAPRVDSPQYRGTGRSG